MGAAGTVAQSNTGSSVVVDEVAVVAPVDEVGSAIKARYGDRLARVGYYTLAGGVSLSDGDLSGIVADTR